MIHSKSSLSLILFFAVLLVPLLVLIPGQTGFPYPPGGEYSDITVSHYPNAIYLRSVIQDFRTIPLWSETILGGYPFAANPLSGLWYPLGWIALFLPLPFGFNLLILLHLLWGGIGMYLLLRQEGLARNTAILGAIAFEALPKLFAHYGAGHISLIYSVCWTPWLLYTYRIRYIDHVSVLRRWMVWLCQPGLILALILVADVRWGYYAGILWWGYTFAHSHQQLAGSRFWVKLKTLFVHSTIGFLLAAPFLLPFIEYTQLSTRMVMSSESQLTYSFPPARLLGLFFPDFGGFHEWVIYPGGVVIVLALIGWTWVREKTDLLFWQATVLISLLLSFGALLPGMDTVFALPGLNLLRVPSRWLFISGIGFAALAAHCLQRIGDGLELKTKKRFNLSLVAISMLVVLWFIGVWVLTSNLTAAYLWGVLMIISTAVCIYLILNGRLSVTKAAILLILLCIVDLTVTNATLFETKAVDAILAEAKAEASSISESQEMFRIYSPSYSMPQHIAAINDYQLTEGVDPLQLSSYADYMEGASGVPVNGYSVVLPPIFSGDPKTANSMYVPNPFLLGLLNVKYVLSAYPIQVDGLMVEKVFEESILYSNREMRPRAWVQSSGDPSGQVISPVQITLFQPNKIELDASGPGLLVLSEIDYPGWRAWVDDIPIEIKPYMGILRSIELDQGTHHIRYNFFPTTLYIGLVLCALGAAVLILVIRRTVR